MVNSMSKNPRKPVEIYGHRGSRAYAPENTIPAFDFAIKSGVDYLDMDIVVTADNVIVASHDLWLNPDIIMQHGRYINHSERKLVKNLTFNELQTYNVGLNPNSNYAKFFPLQQLVPNTKIPSLQQVIDHVNNVTCTNHIDASHTGSNTANSNYVNLKCSNHNSLNHNSPAKYPVKCPIRYQIEVKNDPLHPEYSLSPIKLATLLYDILSVNNLLEYTEVQAFDWNILFELQKLNPKIKTAYLLSADDIYRMQHNDINLANLYHAGYLLKDFNYSIPQMIKSLGGSCYDPEDTALTKNDLDTAHNLGLKVVVWRYPEMSGSIFDPILMQKLVAWGVDGVIVDDPTIKIKF